MLVFSMFIQQALPIIRQNDLGQNRLLMIEDKRDLEEHSVTGTDLQPPNAKIGVNAKDGFNLKVDQMLRKD